jgi:hypothetical protein
MKRKQRLQNRPLKPKGISASSTIIGSESLEEFTHDS